jgi:hypothetical protein
MEPMDVARAQAFGQVALCPVQIQGFQWSFGRDAVGANRLIVLIDAHAPLLVS